MNTFRNAIFSPLALLAFTFILLTGCKDDDESFQDVNITPVVQFYEPANNRNVVLQAAGNMYFEWEKARADDNSVVYYDVLFDKADGDFSKPLYMVTSDNKGISNGATLPHKTLNKIARLAGYDLGEVGTLKWTVRSARGIHTKMAEETRTLSLVRINSVDDLEGTPLFITGEGSEDGQPVKPTGTVGEYEIYTRLEAGKPFYFHATASGVTRTFTIDAGNTTFRETNETPEGSTVTESGVYRITFDFEAAAVTLNKINNLTLFISEGGRRTDFTYTSKGVWELKDYNVQLPKPGWGAFDERYKLIFTVDGAEEHWGQEGTYEDQRPPLNSPGYRDMAPAENDPYKGAFKFPNELVDAADLDKYTVDVTVYMTADRNYTHEFTNIRQ